MIVNWISVFEISSPVASAYFSIFGIERPFCRSPYRKPRVSLCANIAHSIRARGFDILRINYLLRWSAMHEMRRDMHRGWWNVCMPGAYHWATAICSFRIRFPTGCLRISFYSSYVAGTAPRSNPIQRNEIDTGCWFRLFNDKMLRVRRSIRSKIENFTRSGLFPR